MYKKIISILLCIFTLLGSANLVNAEKRAKMDKNEIVEILKVLDMLSDDYDSVTIDWDKHITKAEFADMAADVLKRDHKSNGKRYFHDISSQHWASEGITTLVECGLLEVGADKRFNPTDTVTMEFAAKIILNALGYKYNFENNAHLDLNTVARGAGITNGITNADSLTFNDAIQLMYNALTAEVFEISGLNGSAVTYKATGEIYLEREYSVSFKEGVLEGFDGTAFTDSAVTKDMALISGELYEIDGLDLDDLIGHSIYYIYSYDEAMPSKLIWVKKEKTEELVLFYEDNEVSFDKSSYVISYSDTDSNRKKKAELSRNVDVIYNGEYVSSGIEEVLSRNMYSIKLLKEPNDKEYTKVILSDYQNMILGSVDSTKQGIYDRLSKSYLSLNNIDNLKIIKDGREIDFSALVVGDVLSIYKSLSEDTIKVVASSTVAKGDITAKREENGLDYITISGNEYRAYKRGICQNISIGTPVSLYLDANGLIAYAERYVSQGNIAYMVDLKFDDYDESMKVELFKSDGRFVEASVSNTVKINDMKYKSQDAAYKSLGGRDFKSSLILYKADVNGVITNIQFPDEDPDSELKLLQNNVSGTYRTNGRIGRKTYIGDKTVIFAIPRSPKSAKYEDFEVLSKSGMSGDTAYNYSTYSISNEVSYEEIVVLHNFEHSSSSANGLLVAKKLKGVNADDEVVDIIEGYSGANYITLTCAPECSAENIEEGMYITYTAKGNGSVSTITVRCHPEGGIRPLEKELHRTTAFSSGYVNKVVGDIVRIGDSSGADFDAAYVFSASIPVLVYTEFGEVEVGSIANLKSYESAGNDCSYVFTHVRHGGSIVYVIYE